jgi:hypothetical protein
MLKKAPPEEIDPVLALARMRVRRYYRLSHRLWSIHMWCAGVSDALVLVIPFALAGMLWMPHQWQMLTNVVTLSLSALSAVLKFFPPVQRTRDRALLLRRMYQDLELAVAKYESKTITPEHLIGTLEAVTKLHLSEAAP